MSCSENWLKRGSGPSPPSSPASSPNQAKKFKSDSRNWEEFQELVEEGMLDKCLCKLPQTDLVLYLDTLLRREKSEQTFLLTNLLAWLGQTFHEDLLTGEVCSMVQRLVNHLLNNVQFLQVLLEHLLEDDPYSQYSSCQAICSLLPLSFCGQDIALGTTKILLNELIGRLKFTSSSEVASLPVALSEVPVSASVTTSTANGHGRLEASYDSVSATLSPDLMSFACGDSTDCLLLEESSLHEQSWILRTLSEFVSHGGKQRDDGNPINHPIGCNVTKLEDEMLCQELQVKCLVLTALGPVWPRFAATLADTTLKSTARVKDNTLAAQHRVSYITYLTEGFRLWKSLITIRANLNFVDSRSFAAHLHQPLYSLQVNTPACIWRSLLDTVSECLCYGSTLGLQSIPPEEPCQLAHTLIRLVRFENFLSRVPFGQSIGFGGTATSTAAVWTTSGGEGRLTGSEGDQVVEAGEERYDKGLVQKMVLIILKSVALTTREARVDSSSGESDSSVSSRGSGSSCSSDLIIIERNMSGMYKQLDVWIKSVLPVLPDSSLQNNLLHLLQEQDDVLIEGLLCLLDTHIALHVPARDTQMVFSTCPTAGFIKFISIVGGDSSVLLDFLVSNETCFLLYLLRYLKYIVKDWTLFVSSCAESYNSTLEVILNLRSSISRLLDKELFPYNIGPVYKLLQKVEELSRLDKNHT